MKQLTLLLFRSVLSLSDFRTICSTDTAWLQAGLTSFGAQPVTSCQFDFSSVLTDVATMSATARLVENLGVSAYLGGAALLSDPRLLVSAGTILTVEARHQTVLNILSGTGVVVPQAFDVGFTPSEVLAMASGFISGCDLGIPGVCFSLDAEIPYADWYGRQRMLLWRSSV